MQECVNQCLNSIIRNDVDEVVRAFRETYFWYINKNFPSKASYESVLDRFLSKISQTLGRDEFKRQQISEEEISRIPFRSDKDIAHVIQKFLKTTTKEDGIDFLG